MYWTLTIRERLVQQLSLGGTQVSPSWQEAHQPHRGCASQAQEVTKPKTTEVQHKGS